MESFGLGKLEKQREQRGNFRSDLDKLISLGATRSVLEMEKDGREKLQTVQADIEKLKESMEQNYGDSYPGLMDRVLKGSTDEVSGFINPPEERPLEMNWYPSRLEKK